MKERPILFSGPMVRAILAGTKTQTRRVLKQATGPSLSVDCSDNGVAELSWLWGDGPGYDVNETIKHVPCPYGQPGDRLWVRENFQPLLADGFEPYEADWETGWGYAPRHVATDGAVEFIDMDDNISSRVKPSIHMPRWASRLTLEITGVRVERLQYISEADALAEGIVQLKDGGFGLPAGEHYHCADPRQSYFSLWQAINGPGSVEANPWVWVVEFKKLETA